jgi:hypothetical protein
MGMNTAKYKTRRHMTRLFFWCTSDVVKKEYPIKTKRNRRTVLFGKNMTAIINSAANEVLIGI